MILAIVGRDLNVEEHKPFNRKYYIAKEYTEIFDALDILLFPVLSEQGLEKVCEMCDGLIVPGSGKDIHPRYYNEEPILDIDYSVDEFKLDKQLIELFAAKKKPILGICGGIQSINVAFGGSLHQQVAGHVLGDSTHDLHVSKDTFLYETYQKETLPVNSLHRLAVKDVAPGFVVSGITKDGVVEAIEKDNIIAVQWHPEIMRDMEFFKYFQKKFL